MPGSRRSRDRNRAQLLEVLAELAELCEADGSGAEAVAYAERLLRLDPLAESSYRLLMRLHFAHGDRARALRAYHLCSSTLERELGVEPSPATRAAYAALLPPVTVAPTPARAGGRPPLVGRDRERARLGAAWKAAGAGRAQLCLVAGEAGVGKTRLAEEFQSWCGRQGATTADARCYAAEGPLPYGAVTAWLRSDAIRPRLAGLDRVRLVELTRLLPELLLEVADLPAPEALPEDEQRSRVFDAVVAAFDLAPSPLVLVVDDLQFADRETCRLIHYLLRVRPESALLVVATARSGEGSGEAMPRAAGRARHPGPADPDRARAVGSPGAAGPGRTADRRTARSDRCSSGCTSRPAAIRCSWSKPFARGGGPAARARR